MNKNLEVKTCLTELLAVMTKNANTRELITSSNFLPQLLEEATINKYEVEKAN